MELGHREKMWNYVRERKCGIRSQRENVELCQREKMWNYVRERKCGIRSGEESLKKQKHLGLCPNLGTPRPPSPTLGLPKAEFFFGLPINLKSQSEHFW